MQGLIQIQRIFRNAFTSPVALQNPSIPLVSRRSHVIYSKRCVGARKGGIKFPKIKRGFCSVVSQGSKSVDAVKDSVQVDVFKSGWYGFLPEGVEARRVIQFDEPLERQFSLVSENEGNRHLRYDLVTLCLRILRSPLTEEYDKCSIVLSVAESSLNIISHAEKFKIQLKSHLEKHITPVQRLDIKTKIGEHKAKLFKTEWSSIPLMAAYAHFLMLDGQLEEAWKVVNRSLLLSQSLLYFQLGLELEHDTEGDKNLLIPAATMYYRSVMRNSKQSESWTNLAVLDFYHGVDTSLIKESIEEEEKKKRLGKGYNPKQRKDENDKSLKDRRKVALELLDRAISSDDMKKNFLAYYHKGFILETGLDEPNWKEKARENYSKALEINPDHLQSLSHLGSLLMDEKLLDKALKHFQRAKEVGNSEILVYLNLAHCHAKMGHIEASTKEMATAMRREPKMAELQYQMGMILLREASKEKQRGVDPIIERDGGVSTFLGGSGLHGEKKRKSEALSFFQRSLDLHSAHPEIPFDSSKVYNIMITLLREMAQQTLEEGETVKDFVRASKLLLRTLDLLPPSSSLFPSLLISLSFALMKSNRPSQALDALYDAKKHFSSSPHFNPSLQPPPPPHTSDQDPSHLSNSNLQPRLNLPSEEKPIFGNLPETSSFSSSPSTDLDLTPSHASDIESAFDEYFRSTQQSSNGPTNPQIVFTQLEQHFNALEQTDALIKFLSSSSSYPNDTTSTKEGIDPIMNDNPTSPSRVDPISSLSSIKKKKKLKKIAVGKSVKKIQGRSKSMKKEKMVNLASMAMDSTQTAHIDPTNDDESMAYLDEAIKREMEVHAEEFQLRDSEESNGKTRGDEVGLNGVVDELNLKRRSVAMEAKAEELERLMVHKAKLHYNIAFCMHYIGEMKEIKKHLELALDAAPEEELCTSDYIVFDKEDNHHEYDEIFSDESMLEEGNEKIEDLKSDISENSLSSPSSRSKDTVEDTHPYDKDSTSSFGLFEDDQVILEEMRKASFKQSSLQASKDAEMGDVRSENDDEEILEAMEAMMQEMGVDADHGTGNVVFNLDSNFEDMMTSSGKSKVKKSKSNPESVHKMARRVTLKPYSQKGLEEQLESLIHPPDGSQRTHATDVLLKWLCDVQEKSKNMTMEEVDAQILKSTEKGSRRPSSLTGASPVRSAKSKRRKQLKYSIDASKTFRRGGPDDGFDSPL